MDINVYIYPRMVSITMMVSMFDNICNVCRLLSNNKKYLYMPTTVVKFYISLFILPYTTLSHILYYTCEGTFKYYMSTSWPGDFNQGKCLVRLTYVHKLIIYLKTKIPILKYRWKLSLQNLYQEALFNKILLSNNHFVGGGGSKSVGKHDLYEISKCSLTIEMPQAITTTGWSFTYCWNFLAANFYLPLTGDKHTGRPPLCNYLISKQLLLWAMPLKHLGHFLEKKNTKGSKVFLYFQGFCISSVFDSGWEIDKGTYLG